VTQCVAVIGSREFPGASAYVAMALNLVARDTVIVTGDARGIDRAAANYADEHLDTEPVIVRADWDTLGKIAGKRRNWQIIRQADQVIAFWDGTSNGTAHAIAAAVRERKPVRIWMPGDS